MSNIVVLDSRRDIRRQRTPSSEAGSGVVLLFTGVRYEREAEPRPPADSPPSRQTTRKRRRRS